MTRECNQSDMLFKHATLRMHSWRQCWSNAATTCWGNDRTMNRMSFQNCAEWGSTGQRLCVLWELSSTWTFVPSSTCGKCDVRRCDYQQSDCDGTGHCIWPNNWFYCFRRTRHTMDVTHRTNLRWDSPSTRWFGSLHCDQDLALPERSNFRCHREVRIPAACPLWQAPRSAHLLSESCDRVI